MELISRQAVLDAVDAHKYSDSFCEEHNIDWSINLGMVHILVNELPYQHEKVGKWIHKNDDCNDWLECSECEYGSEGEVKFGHGTNFCPNCGAKMEV